MALKLFDWVNSYNSRKILAVAFETDQRIDCHAVNMQAGEHKKPEYLAKNPNGKVPMLSDGGFHLWESNAIVCYLAGKDPSRRLLPADPQQRAVIDQWMFWQTAHLAPSLGKIGYERIWKKRLGHGEPDESLVQAAMPEVNRFMGVLDQWLASREWIAGNISVADFCVATTLAMRHEMQFDLKPWPHVAAWVSRIESRPSWQQALKSW